jgi:hypothetical protein
MNVQEVIEQGAVLGIGFHIGTMIGRMIFLGWKVTSVAVCAVWFRVRGGHKGENVK